MGRETGDGKKNKPVRFFKETRSYTARDGVGIPRRVIQVIDGDIKRYYPYSV